MKVSSSESRRQVSPEAPSDPLAQETRIEFPFPGPGRPGVLTKETAPEQCGGHSARMNADLLDTSSEIPFFVDSLSLSCRLTTVFQPCTTLLDIQCPTTTLLMTKELRTV